MGHFSLLLIRHDAAGYIEKNPQEFWESAWHAIQGAASVPQQFGVGGAYPAGVALFRDFEAGGLRLLLVGGGTAQTLSYQVDTLTEAGWDTCDEQVQLLALRQAAKKLGYRLSKIPKLKPKLTQKREKHDKRKRT